MQAETAVRFGPCARGPRGDLAMRLILIGPPGSGKGTQAKLLSMRTGLFHFGTGDILREAVRLHTPAGAKAKPYVTSGQLVPDDLVNELVADRFRREDRPDCFIMDGYPRTLAQAASFDQVLRQQFFTLDAVIFLDVDDEEIVRRLSGRWSCPKPGCMATYHTQYNQPRFTGVCDICGTVLVQRDDDKEETVRRRLVVYHQNTEKLLGHYRSQGLLRRIPGEGDIETIYSNIARVLKEAGSSC
jgi:adenylate kinase